MVTLEPGGHPRAWELSVITRGTATWTLLDPLPMPMSSLPCSVLALNTISTSRSTNP